MKTLYIVRGVPGSGKSTFAKSIGGIHIEADFDAFKKAPAAKKIADGTLVNIYATNQAELEASLTSIADVSTLITSTGTALGATAQSTAGAVAYAKKALGGTTVVPDGAAPDCKQPRIFVQRSH